MMTEQQIQRFDKALRRLGGDQDMLKTLASIAAEDAPPMLSKLDEKAAAGENADYAMAAHALKGMLSTFETDEPVSELQQIIDAARQHNSVEVRKLHDLLAPELEKLIGEISNVAQVSGSF
jgi:HPt (histidine-containing phosphotransfer) domain-containing protein